MSADVRLSLGAQAVLERRIRDLRLIQHSLTDTAIGYAAMGRRADSALCLTESEAIRQALNEIEAVLRVAYDDALISGYTKE